MARVLLERPKMLNRSCERLRREHELIGDVLGGLDVLVQHGRGGGRVPAPAISGAVDFFSAFVDGCHDPKEEEGLFPVLDAYGIPAACVVAALRSDHEEGRRLLGMLRPFSGRRRIDADACAMLEAYASLVRHHIASENAEILPFAERVMSVHDDERVEHTFDRIEERALGPGGREVFMTLANAVTHVCRSIATEPAMTPTTLDTLVRHVMRPRPRSITPDESLARAAAIMDTLGSRELPVVAGRALVGILTRTDMEPHRGHYEWTTVRAAMTRDPVTVSADTPIRVVATLLLEHGFNSVPVTSDGDLVGMIARSDVLRVLAQNS